MNSHGFHMKTIMRSICIHVAILPCQFPDICFISNMISIQKLDIKRGGNIWIWTSFSLYHVAVLPCILIVQKQITAVTRQAVEEAEYYWLISGKTKTLCTKNWMKYYLKLNIERQCKHIQTCMMVKSELEMLEIFWPFENIIQCLCVRLIVDCVILYSLR